MNRDEYYCASKGVGVSKRCPILNQCQRRALTVAHLGGAQTEGEPAGRIPAASSEEAKSNVIEVQGEQPYFDSPSSFGNLCPEVTLFDRQAGALYGRAVVAARESQSVESPELKRFWSEFFRIDSIDPLNHSLDPQLIAINAKHVIETFRRNGVALAPDFLKRTLPHIARGQLLGQKGVYSAIKKRSIWCWVYQFPSGHGAMTTEGDVCGPTLEREYRHYSQCPEYSYWQANHAPKIPTGNRRGSKFSPSLRFEILRRDQFRCRYCGRSQSDGVKLQIDHVVPVTRGGTDARDNLVTACEDCNLGKSDKIIDSLPRSAREPA